MPRRPARYYPSYGPLLPTSGPDWVWQRAEYLVETGRNASKNRDGPDIVRAIKYIRAMRHGFTGRHGKIRNEDPDLVDAVTFRNTQPWQTIELHCRVLARQSDAVIAAEMGLRKEVVEAYCRTFFNVRQFLDSQQYILYRVIGINPDYPPSAEAQVMLAAYHHGPHALDQLLDWWPHQGEAHDLTTAAGRVREAIEIFVAAQQLPADDSTQMTLAKNANLTFGKRQKLFRIRSPREVFSENVSKMLSEVVWCPTKSESKRSVVKQPQQVARGESQHEASTA